jgi:hypothetical protein
MTKKEALQAKKQLTDNSLTPAQSTRSNDRNLDQVNNIYIYIYIYILCLKRYGTQ